MAQHTRLEVVQRMKESGVVPLFYHPDIEIVKQVIEACYKGGLKLFEFTNRGDFAHEVFGELSHWAQDHYPDLVLGVGSVVDPGTCSLYIQLGAAFIVSPLLSESMAPVCNRRKVLWIPGAATPSEISRAEELGAEVVKVYPAPLVGGPSFIKTVLGPCPWSQLMPSGGVEPTEENLSSWFEAGAFCVGMGSKLITSDIIRNGDFNTLEKDVSALVAMVGKIERN